MDIRRVEIRTLYPLENDSWQECTTLHVIFLASLPQLDVLTVNAFVQPKTRYLLLHNIYTINNW